MLFLALITILALVLLPTPSASQGESTLTLPPRVISSNQQAVCPPDEMQETARNETTQDIRNSIRNTILWKPYYSSQSLHKTTIYNIMEMYFWTSIPNDSIIY